MARERRKPFPSELEDKFMLRMPGDLRQRVKSHAVSNGRSMNAEIVLVLEAAFPAPAKPEHVNERLLNAALLLAGQWSAALEGMGVDPDQHPALQKFHKEAQEAMEADNG